MLDKTRILKLMLIATATAAIWCATIARPAMADGTLTGNCWIEKVKGRTGGADPYLALYEWNIYCVDNGGTYNGKSYRVGSPPNPQSFYTFTMPGDTYSMYLDQPLFWGRPKVVANVSIPSSGSTGLNVQLSTDYSCAFGSNSGIWGSDPWTSWQSAWYQTFVATGTSVTGVNFKVAGANAADMLVSVHSDNAGSITTWPQVGISRVKPGLSAVSDQWVRFRSGQVPTVPGQRYALKLTGINGVSNNDFAVYRRNEDGQGYADGQAYDSGGNAQNFDLYEIICSDNDGTLVSYCSQVYDSGALAGWAGVWTQQVKAIGQGLAGATLYYAGGDTWDKMFTFRIRSGSVNGPQVGPAKNARGAYQALSFGHVAASWNPGEVTLTPGTVYYIEVSQAQGFNPSKFTQGANDYPDGHAFQSYSAQTGVDLHMQVVEYAEDTPVIRVAPTELNPVTNESQNPAAGSFVVQNTGSGTLEYTISDDAAWLSCSPTSGTSTGEEDAITVTYAATNLLPGTYQATISVSDSEAINSPQTVAVTLTVIGSTGCTPLNLLNPGFESGSANWSGYCDDSSTIWSPGGAHAGTHWGSVQQGGAQSPRFAWQTVATGSDLVTLTGVMADGSHQSHDHVVQLIDGDEDGTVMDEFRRTNAPGQSHGWTSIGMLYGTPTSGYVTVKYGWINNTSTWSNGTATHVDSLVLKTCVGGEMSEITLSPTSLSPETDVGFSPSADTFTVTNTGDGTLSYTISDNVNWLSCSPASGTSTGESDTITVTYSTASLAAGSYNATITVSDPNASNNPQTISVALTVNEEQCINGELVNGGFESGQSPWVTFGSTDGVVSSGYHNVTSHGGSKMFGVGCSWQTRDGGAYQQIEVCDGAEIEATVWIWTDTSGAAYDTNCRIGIDPYGGTDKTSANVVWTDWANSVDQWSQIGLTGANSVTAENTTITVFIEHWHRWALSYNLTLLDDVQVTITGGGPPPPPAIALNPTSLSPATQEGSSPAAGSFTVTNSGGGTLSYTISDNVSWLACTPTSGTSTGEADTIAVNYSTSGLSAGTYNATITVSDPNATNNPQTVAVSLTVSETPPCENGELVNGGFESGQSPWVTFGSTDGVVDSGYHNVTSHGGSKMFGVGCSWQTRDGGAYQQIDVCQGAEVEATVWIWTDTTAAAYDTNCRIGIDPYGGTDKTSANVVWTDWANSVDQWSQIGLTGANSVTAENTTVTVFIEHWHRWAVTYNLTLLDDVQVAITGGN